MTGGKQPPDRAAFWRGRMPCAVLLVVAAGLRLYRMGFKSLWVDESYAVFSSMAGWLELPARAAASTPHPPLGFYLIKLSGTIFGEGEMGLRLLVGLLVASSVVPAYSFLRRRLGGRGAFWGALLWALAPYSVSLGQEAWIYGTLAALTLWAVDAADRAWKGSGRALWCFMGVAVAGLLTQHIFVMVVLACFGLWLAAPPARRPRKATTAVLLAVLLLVFATCILFFTDELVFRSKKLDLIGSDAPTLADRGLSALAAYSQLLPDGLMPVDAELALSEPDMTTWIMLLVVLLQTAMIAAGLSDRSLQRGERIWMALLFVAPWALFLRDEPSARQLSLCWVPLLLAAGSVFRRLRWSGPVAAAACMVGLVFYYGIDAFPYHRSNWREAASAVEDGWSRGDAVLVSGGKFGGLAWKYYAPFDYPVYSLHGMNPFVNSPSVPQDPVPVLDSLMRSHERVWIVIDHWQSESAYSFLKDYHSVMSRNMGGTITVMLIE